VGGAQNGFTFFWLNETGTNQTADNALVIANADATIVDDGNYTGLIPGYYTVVARNNSTSCSSQPITRTVIDATVQTNINITIDNRPSDCAVADGAMTASVTGGVGPFALSWFRGGPTNSDINFFNNPPVFNPPASFASTANVTGLESQLYTLVVQDNGNGCGNYQPIFLPFIDAHQIDARATEATNCTAVNGEVEVELTVIPVGAVNDYVF